MRFILIVFLVMSGLQAVCQKKDSDVCYDPNKVTDTTKKSIKSMALGVIGGDTIQISYHSPGVRKRIIWGGLVPYDEVWVTGAHNATNIVIPRDVIIEEKRIPAGKYAVFTIPGPDKWTIIFNKHWDQHLAGEYDPKDDIIRIQVTPIVSSHTERLQYFIEPGSGKTGKIAMQWEKVRIEFPIRFL